MQTLIHKPLTRFSGMALVVVTVCGTGNAALFTNEADFNAAVSGLTVVGSENFDALPTGSVSNPAVFMGGLIELGDTTPSIGTGTRNRTAHSEPNEWGANNPGGANNPVTITGPGATPLGFRAFGLWNIKQADGTWTVSTSSGVEELSQGMNFTYSFLGWVGASGETLNSISYNTGGIHFDDLVAYTPEPGTAMLFMGLGVLGVMKRRCP